MKKLFTFALTCMIVIAAHSQLLLQESFNYEIGGLEGQGGWTLTSNPSWQKGETPKVSSIYLEYEGYLGSGGKSASLENGNDRISYKSFVDEAITSGSVYVAFLVNVSTTDKNIDFFMFDPLDGKAPRAKVNATVDGDGFKFGITMTLAGSTLYSPKLKYGETHLLVLKYTFVEGANNDIVALFVNPAPGTSEASQVSTKLVATPDGDIAGIKNIAIRQRGMLGLIGGIRIARTWEEAVAGDPGLILESSIPEKNGYYSPATGLVTLNYTKALDVGTGNILLKSDDETIYSVSVDDVSISGNVVTFALPQELLVRGNMYDIEIPEGAFIGISKNTPATTISFRVFNQLPYSLKGSTANPWKGGISDAVISGEDIIYQPDPFEDPLYVCAHLTSTSNYVQVGYEGTANLLTFRIRSSSSGPGKGYEFEVLESPNGQSWTEIAAYVGPNMLPYSNKAFALMSYPLKADTRFIKWNYKLKPSGASNIILDDITIGNVINDMTGPLFVSSVPAAASTVGEGYKIIKLKFDEKVKVNADMITSPEGTEFTMSKIRLNDLPVRWNGVETDDQGNVIVYNHGDEEFGIGSHIISFPAGTFVDMFGNECAEKTFTFNVTEGGVGITSQADNKAFVSIKDDILSVVGAETELIELYNVMGVKIAVSNGTPITIAGYPSGIYTVCYRTVDGIFKVKVAF